MNKTQRDNILKLCEVLESGKYKKAECALRKSDSFCCLGIACEISQLGHWGLDGDLYRYIVGDHRPSGVLPPPVMEHYGFPNIGGFTDDNGLCLINLNDGIKPDYTGKSDQKFEAWTHPEISTHIRKWVSEQVITDEV